MTKKEFLPSISFKDLMWLLSGMVVTISGTATGGNWWLQNELNMVDIEHAAIYQTQVAADLDSLSDNEAEIERLESKPVLTPEEQGYLQYLRLSVKQMKRKLKLN